MKNFSSITENLDITTKKYVDDNKVTSVDGLSGGTLTSPLKISGGNQSTASKISLNQSANGQITDSSTSTLFGFMSSTTLTVGDNGYALALRGSGIRPTYKDADLALYSDIPTVPDISGLMPKSGGTFTGDVTVASGHHLKTDLIKSADDSKWIAEITPNGLEIGGNGTPLRFYSNTRLVHATVNKELAYTSDIPAFELTGTSLTITL